MTIQAQVQITKPTESIIGIVKVNPAERKIKEVLGAGFFINAKGIALTAKHIFDDYDDKTFTLKAVIIDRTGKTIFPDVKIIRKSINYDITAIEVLGIVSAPFYNIQDGVLMFNRDYVSVDYSQTSITYNPSTLREDVLIVPATRKGNIVIQYESNFPEKVPTKCIELSFPVLQGASGAPIMENYPPWNVVGMLTHNIERQLVPAQTVKIRDGENYTEETKYYMPHAKAICASHLLDFVKDMGLAST